ncbi:hypothetical protein LJC68_09030 [Bacteroidales bacterium OttesenSCG-928-B11]|nr:hypothetical protein [Bacteroidales bacterium OttesenSCG-928-B11]
MVHNPSKGEEMRPCESAGMRILWGFHPVRDGSLVEKTERAINSVP